jgi:hypothetical protein
MKVKGLCKHFIKNVLKILALSEVIQQDSEKLTHVPQIKEIIGFKDLEHLSRLITKN